MPSSRPPRSTPGARGDVVPRRTALEPLPARAPVVVTTRLLDEPHIARALIGMLSLVPEARVVPLRKGTTTGFAQMVTVGRAPNMDVVLEDDSVSKFHAFFTQDADGWLLEDAGSTNGTLVNDHKLTPHGGGTRLRVGARVVFGSAPAFSFFPPRDFHALLREAAAVDPHDDLEEPADPAGAS